MERSRDSRGPYRYVRTREIIMRMTERNSVVAPLGYLAESRTPPRYRIYPPAQDKDESPPSEHHDVRVFDCREIASDLTLDVEGFVVRNQTSSVKNFFDDEIVRSRYYAEVEALVKDSTGAQSVIVFDHNVRSVEKAAKGQTGVRAPVDAVHNDYNGKSGRQRVQELLKTHNLSDLKHHRTAIINVWRPIRGPVRDRPLAICDTRTVSHDEFVETDIEHYGDDGSAKPNHTGQIYSLRYNPKHRWYYVAEMQPSEVLLFKCYDSLDGVARFTPHTGFNNPECPSDFVPRESIEARTLVIFP
jgi:hypothetical protein